MKKEIKKAIIVILIGFLELLIVLIGLASSILILLAGKILIGIVIFIITYVLISLLNLLYEKVEGNL